MKKGVCSFRHGDLAPYVGFPLGEPHYDVFQIVKSSMSSRMRSALYKVKRSEEPVSFHSVFHETRH